MLLLDNQDVEAVVTVEACIAAIREVYLEAGAGGAAFRPRSTFHVDQGGDRRFTFATMEGVSAAAGVAALRIRSDLVEHHAASGHETKYSTRPGDYCGLILLFRTDNAEPIAIFNDGVLQHMRVAATAAVAAGSMAREDARVLGIIGAGGHAWEHLQAYRAVRPIERVVIASRTAASRDRFIRDARERLGIDVEPADDPRAVVEAADILATCTSSTRPVLDAGWITEGTHVSSVRHWSELGPDILDRADRIVIHERQHPKSYRVSSASDGAPVEPAAGTPEAASATPIPDGLPTLVDLLADPGAGRRSAGEVTYFLNSIGTGIQFAACAALAYRAAVDRGIGRTIPTEWFLQQIPD